VRRHGERAARRTAFHVGDVVGDAGRIAQRELRRPCDEECAATRLRDRAEAGDLRMCTAASNARAAEGGVRAVYPCGATEGLLPCACFVALESDAIRLDAAAFPDGDGCAARILRTTAHPHRRLKAAQGLRSNGLQSSSRSSQVRAQVGSNPMGAAAHALELIGRDGSSQVR
jgi:hypothetical protein